MIKIGIIGCGNMGEAILKGIKGKFSVLVSEPNASKRRAIRRSYRLKAKSIADVVKASKVIIIAVKPQDIDGVLKEMSASIRKSQLVVSIVAGITISFLEKKLGRGVKVIRTMPNLPAQIGEGITALSKGKYAKLSDMSLACRIFNQVGTTIVLNEKQLDAVTAVSGSGPAYVFLFVESMIKAAKKLGLSDAVSKQLVYSTLLGSSHLLNSRKISAEQFRAKVTSKGGTTFAAAKIFNKNNFQKIFNEALKAAEKRAKQLSRR